MQASFQLGADGIPGGEHTRHPRLRNNQDAFTHRQYADLTVAVVADGCSDPGVEGSLGRSEGGAHIGAQVLRNSLKRHWRRMAATASSRGLAGFTEAIPFVVEAARQDLISHLRVLALAMEDEQGSLSTVVDDNFLFTLVGALITPVGSAFFAIGDGVIVTNGKVLRIGPFNRANKPPYLAYALYPSSSWKDAQLHFVMHRIVATEELDTFLIGSDGVSDLYSLGTQVIEKPDGTQGPITIPGSSELIGPLEQYWTKDVYFTKTGIRRRLALINSRHTSVRGGELFVEGPLLPDDTTFVVGRRRK